MAAKALDVLKTPQLRHVAFLLGIPTAGRKAELIDILAAQAENSPVVPSQRILSVDMGIRNLAYCVVDTMPEESSKVNIEGPTTNLHVSTWSKTDLLKESPKSMLQAATDDNHETMDQRDKEGKAMSDAFKPSHLSRTAVHIIQKLLAHRPHKILIERQRFRSSRGANIQEWTVRVNMLESMLWACLRALEAQDTSSTFPTSHEVSPARVANFWQPGTSVSLRLPTASFYGLPAAAKAEKTGSTPKRKVEKADKINIVRSWLEGNGDVKLTFEGEAAIMAEHFRSSTRRRSAQSSEVGKLDDLADSLLQAAAWARWEENKRAFATLLAKTIAG